MQVQLVRAEVASGTHQTDRGLLREDVARRIKAAWPRLDLDLEPFIQSIQGRLDQQNAPSDETVNLNVEDLFLAYACSRGNSRALAAFEEECADELRGVGAKLRLSATDLEDIRQKIWDKLFLSGDDSPMRILDYRGAGRLRHWFRVLATRCVLDYLRNSKQRSNLRSSESEVVLSARVTEDDPELASVRRQYRDAFRVAFGTAVRNLQPKERNLIRCHYLMGMTTEQLGQAFGAHKATAARHLARTREKLLRDTREVLKLELHANSEELDSVMRLFDQELSTSLSGLLGPEEDRAAW